MLSPWSLPRYNVATSSNERVILSCYFQIYSVSLLTVNWIVFRLLLRGASFHVKGVMNMLRSNANANAAQADEIAVDKSNAAPSGNGDAKKPYPATVSVRGVS